MDTGNRQQQLLLDLPVSYRWFLRDVPLHRPLESMREGREKSAREGRGEQAEASSLDSRLGSDANHPCHSLCVRNKSFCQRLPDRSHRC